MRDRSCKIEITRREDLRWLIEQISESENMVQKHEVIETSLVVSLREKLRNTPLTLREITLLMREITRLLLLLSQFFALELLRMPGLIRRGIMSVVRSS